MVDVVVSLDDGAELELTAVDIGAADGDGILAFTVEGLIRGLETDLMETFRGKSAIPTEIHFRIEDE